MTYVIVFFSQLVYVFFKSFQQLSVVHHKYSLILPVSYAMASCEAVLIIFVATSNNWWLILPMGTGAGLGCMLGMFMHRKYRRMGREKQQETSGLCGVPRKN